MSNIEVGEYVRSKINGLLSKVTDIETFEELGQIVERYILDNNYNKGFCSTEKDSVIVSKNIIDLIEKDDVIKIIENGIISVHLLDEEEYLEMWLEDIRSGCVKLLSIVTKEQFKSIEYRLGE